MIYKRVKEEEISSTYTLYRRKPRSNHNVIGKRPGHVNNLAASFQNGTLY
jgi:hypothetical protein